MFLFSSIMLQAHAKVNLALAVGPPEPPRGYHRIASWFVPVDLHDDVRIEALGAGVPSRYEIRWAADAPRPTPIDWPPEKDLAVRAHRLLERYAGRALPVAMTVEKRTPVGGGLGGGSSDAATALMGVNRVHGLGLGASDLRGLSTELGADVAFFLDEASVEGRRDVPRSGMVTGFGEHIERTGSPRGTLSLFFPPFGCPTGEVYKAFDAAPTTRVDDERVRRIIEGTLGAGGTVDDRALFNDLAGPACVVAPHLRQVWDGLQRACGDAARVHLTGSGSTMFALVPADQAEALRQRLGKALPEVASIPARLMGG
jgi:4-diphosphocytidyl-2-C-methyl-D-erythritol kinase